MLAVVWHRSESVRPRYRNQACRSAVEEQRRRIDVRTIPADAQVKRAAGGTQSLTTVNDVALRHGDARQPGQRGTEAVGMFDRHDQTPGDLPSEHDPTGTDGSGVAPDLRAVLQATVPGTEAMGRRPERIDHGSIHGRTVGHRRSRTAARWSRSTRGTASGICTGRTDGEGEDDEEGPCRDPAAQSDSRSMLTNRERRCRTDFVWIWHTLDSVTPRTRPISCSVRFS